MTSLTRADRTVGGTSIWQRLSDLKTSMAQRRVYRSTVKELSTLSNRDLHDIGIHPADIARQGAYGA